MTVFASHFLAGGILSLLMPVLLLIVIVVWYWFAVKRVPDGGPSGQATPEASAETPAAARPPEGGPQPTG